MRRQGQLYQVGELRFGNRQAYNMTVRGQAVISYDRHDCRIEKHNLDYHSKLQELFVLLMEIHLKRGEQAKAQLLNLTSHFVKRIDERVNLTDHFLQVKIHAYMPLSNLARIQRLLEANRKLCLFLQALQRNQILPMLHHNFSQ